ncbi:MAG TPA: FMN-binding protein [Oscillospiraceae bacterium]|nr:FMN-binding protein [Oscillospiraceae bacterium]
MAQQRVKKKPDSPARMVIVLFLITAVSALLLGFVNYKTSDRIAAQEAEKAAAAMEAVLPAGSYTELAYTGGDDRVAAVYDADGTGYVVEVKVNGFGGTIDMMVGVADGKVTGTEIISMSETSGLGSNAKDPTFRDQYIGGGGPFSLAKNGGTIQALTSATVTSRAFTAGVNAALDAAAATGGEG